MPCIHACRPRRANIPCARMNEKTSRLSSYPLHLRYELLVPCHVSELLSRAVRIYPPLFWKSIDRLESSRHANLRADITDSARVYLVVVSSPGTGMPITAFFARGCPNQTKLSSCLNNFVSDTLHTSSQRRNGVDSPEQRPGSSQTRGMHKFEAIPYRYRVHGAI